MDRQALGATERRPWPDIRGRCAVSDQHADAVCWIVSSRSDETYPAWGIDSVYAAFTTADSRLKRLASEFPEWEVKVEKWLLRNDGPECGSAGTVDPTGPPRDSDQ